MAQNNSIKQLPNINDYDAPGRYRRKKCNFGYQLWQSWLCFWYILNTLRTSAAKRWCAHSEISLTLMSLVAPQLEKKSTKITLGRAHNPSVTTLCLTPHEKGHKRESIRRPSHITTFYFLPVISSADDVTICGKIHHGIWQLLPNYVKCVIWLR